MGDYEKQHYVPEMVLKNFEVDNSFYCYNGTKKWKSCAEKSCKERYLYKFNEDKTGIEKVIGKIETIYGPFLKTIINNYKTGYLFNVLTEENRESLCWWISFSFTRSKALHDFEVAKGTDKNFPIEMLKTPEKISNILKNMPMKVIVNKTNVPFITSSIGSFVLFKNNNIIDKALITLSPQIAIFIYKDLLQDQVEICEKCDRELIDNYNKEYIYLLSKINSINNNSSDEYAISSNGQYLVEMFSKVKRQKGKK